MKNEETFHSMQSVVSVLGEIHLLETYFEGFDKTLTILLADGEINEAIDAAKIFNLHSDVESIKSDIHNITRKLLIIASEMAVIKSMENKKEEQHASTTIKIKKLSDSADSQEEKKNDPKAKSVSKNAWIENASEYFYNIYKNNNSEDGEHS
tara:strand:- start:1512 stop:1967 length:456 start_codon:yes stop_codon:yes gene_type:complete